MSRKITNFGDFKTYQGADRSIQINTLNRLPAERYQLALRRFRERIEQGLPLTAYDDDTPGNKSMGCSWGLCSEDPAAWPDAQDHTFPIDFIKRGRVSVLSASQPCPLDRRSEAQFKAEVTGCFYTCRVFRSKKGDEPMSKELALRLYDQRIKD